MDYKQLLSDRTETIEKVISWLYNDGNYREGYLEEILKENKRGFSTRIEYDDFKKYYLQTGLFYLNDDGNTGLTDLGLNLYQRVRSFKKLEVSLKRASDDLYKQRRERRKKGERAKIFESILKHSNTSVAILSTIATTIISIYSIREAKETGRLEQEKQSATKQIEYLKTVIDSLQKKTR